MFAYFQDNIVAVATAPANGAVGIIRLSGPDAKQILSKIFLKPSGGVFLDFKPRHFYFGRFCDCKGLLLDQGLAVYMPGPRSFTGEDVVELHCHGNLILLRRIVSEILNLPSFETRAADPGEFSRRAFLNGRIDLTQAEAINELISAASEAGLKSTLSNLDGGIKNIVMDLKDRIKMCLSLVEASFEFPDEDIHTDDKNQLVENINGAILNLSKLKDSFQTSKLYDTGISVAIIGPPNVGKSSLLNAILVEDRAIVTETPGTTRDVVEGAKILSGIRFIFRDTAGLRETTDSVETVGIQRSQGLMEKSDVVLCVLDQPDIPENLKELKKKNWLFVLNKVDLLFPGENLELISNEIQNVVGASGFDCAVSALLNFGISDLQRLIESVSNCKKSAENVVHVNERQHKKVTDGLDRFLQIKTLLQGLEVEHEILAEELRGVLLVLDEITGTITNEQILDEIFKRFCIGK